MRIACVHVPQIALQSLCRIDPSLRGAAVAVVGGGADAAGGRPSLALHSPIVVACSRAAWALGVRLGMTAAAARFVSSELRLVAADAQAERDTARALADALLGASAIVDAGGRVEGAGTHLAVYCEVPSKVRGAAYGERLIELAAAFGLTARVGIADDRFTAWVAAAYGDAVGERSVPVDARGRMRPSGGRTATERDGGGGDPGVVPIAGRRKPASRRAGASVGAAAAVEDRSVISVPRGGSAAFLAPRPLSLLAISPEVQHMLEALGVRTLGEFAALPAPSVARPLEADYQALARGDSGHALRPYAPDAPIREELAAGESSGLFGGEALVATLARRLALRLAGRNRRATRLDVTIIGEAGERIVPVAAARAAGAQDELIALLAPLVEQGRSVAKLRVSVVAEAVAGVGADASTDRAVDTSFDALAVGLAGTPPAPRDADLAAAEPVAEPPRVAHRRTRRAGSRQRAVSLVQPQLFGKLEG